MSNKKTTFTLIIYEAQDYLGITILEYCLCDIIYHLSSSHEFGGWCIASREWFAARLSCNRSSIKRYLGDLEKLELIERHPQTKFLRTTQKWYDAVIVKDWGVAQDETQRPKLSRAKTGRGGSKKAATRLNLSHNSNNDNKSSQIKEGRKEKKFIPPTLDEVREYMETWAAEKGGVMAANEPDKFINHYQSNNWHVGKNRMVDWKASARGWLIRNWEDAANKTNRDGKAQETQSIGWDLFGNSNGR